MLPFLLLIEQTGGFDKLGHMSDSRAATFLHPARMLTAGIGVLVMVGAAVGAVFYLIALRNGDLTELSVVILIAVAVGAIGFGLTNAWRTPILVVEPRRLVVPTFFFQREITLRPGYRVGHLLASSPNGTQRVGSIEANKYVYIFGLDPNGAVIELASLHRAAPLITEILYALHHVAGLPVEQIERDRKMRRPWPDVAEWRSRGARVEVQ